MMKPRIALAALAAASIAGFLLLGARSETSAASAGTPSAAPTLPLATSVPTAVPAAHADAAEKPAVVVPSWQDTEIDGDIHFDASGELIPDLALRQFYDYLLTAIGQLPEAQIVQQLRNIGQSRHFNDRQMTALTALFQHYIDYQKAAAALRADRTDWAGLTQVYQARYQLRRDTLGLRAADGFFAESEAYDRYVLAKIEIDNDKTLSPSARAARLAAARTQAPAEVRENEAADATLTALADVADQVRQQGGDAAQLRIAREQIVGAEAAERLQALDDENADWNRRLSALRANKRQLEVTPGLTADDKQRQLDALIARGFSGPDAVRARSLLELNP
ncbi:MAG: hypothetical protein M0Q15_12865 [Nevskia sp.]|jgi:lipase chaperone LimK|nr:hypothetical protein [Nevskia sp.]